MDRIEAAGVLQEFLEDLKARPFQEFRDLIGAPLCIARQGQSGTWYQIECEAVWDFEPEGNLRIIASIDVGSLMSAMFPVNYSFLVTPAGEIIA